MKKLLLIIIFFFFLQNNLIASNKVNIINKLNKTENISFNFIQTINGKDEKGECIIKYPKKIFCNYETRNNKILVSNGSSLVIKNDRQYYRYPIKRTPFEFLLDKNFLIDKINSSTISEAKGKYFFFQINENNNNINIFFSKENYNLVGWQVEDIYQNLAVTYIFNTSINSKIDEKLFKLPKID
jgi:outer membrane lipoprotein-sorting protein|tara:strand:- start:3671 stop:4222 length:552 start_codon:yes stop_codon:yes gene_type:complete